MKKTKILIVDDREENLVALEKILDVFSLEIIRAYSGEEALKQMIEHEFALILMGVQMPDMDGFETVRIMRQDKKLENTPVIFISAIYREEIHYVKGIESGAVDFIFKPIIPQVLNGKVRLFINLYEDRKRLNILNDDLKHSKDIIELVIEKTPIPMVLTDNNQDIVLFNKKFTEQFGYTLADVSTAEKWWKLAYPDVEYRLKVQKSWMTAIDEAEKSNTDIATQVWDLCIKDRTFRTVEFNMTPLDGMSVITMKDITEQLKLAAEHRHLQEQYHQAQKVESIGRLVGGIAHDLNNLLAPIIGYSDLLSIKYKDDERTSSQFDQIVQSSLKARELIRQLLVFSRRQNISYKIENLNNIIEEYSQQLRSEIRENIFIDIQLGDFNKNIKTDPGQIEQLLMNLIVNSQEAIDSNGYITVETSFENFSSRNKPQLDEIKYGEYIILTITDNGRGISEDILNNIVDPFFSTQESSGKGLGLAIVHGIVKQNKGYINISSKISKGTIVEIFFPVNN